MNQHQKHLQELHLRLVEAETNTFHQVHRFITKFEHYASTFTFEKFKKEPNDNASISLKKCETIFDGNYEAILRNVDLLKQCKHMNKQLEFLSKFLL